MDSIRNIFEIKSSKNTLGISLVVKLGAYFTNSTTT